MKSSVPRRARREQLTSTKKPSRQQGLMHEIPSPAVAAKKIRNAQIKRKAEHQVNNFIESFRRPFERIQSIQHNLSRSELRKSLADSWETLSGSARLIREAFRKRA